ncbi:hypothetical protein LCGC14_0018330 [marine sediment metagenome]|uniref:Uncharacterized protein n=1 Tax=marine sediment metagenome TaxID=412755 RepID=A0A0F9YGK1_9ZZZZ
MVRPTPKPVDAVFVNPSTHGTGLNDATVLPPLGLAYMAAVLEANNFSCAIIDANVLQLESPDVLSRIPQQARFIGFYMNSFSFREVSHLVQLCRRERPEAVVVVGGPLASASPEMVLNEIPCHGLIRGEGEYATLRMMENIARGAPAFDPEVSGGVYRDDHNGQTVMNPIERIDDLDQIPFPAYHLLPPLKTYRARTRKSPGAAIVTSRGCAHDCIFCSKDIFQRRVTFHSADSVLADIDRLVNEFGARQIDILDDNFLQKPSRAVKILDGLIERDYGLALNLQSGIRTEGLDRPFLQKMKQAGVYKLAFGIESADPNVLEICHKKLDLEKAERAIRLAKDVGFIVYGFFIIGLPGETDEAFERTMDFARRVDFDVSNFCMATPFIGTELYRMIEAEGRFLVDMTRNIDMGFYAAQAFYEYRDQTAEDMQQRYRRAYREFYTFRKKLKIVMSIRSWSELRWFISAVWFVLKGTLRSGSRRAAARQGPDHQLGEA